MTDAKINMKCRNPDCTSMVAKEVDLPSPVGKRYCCIKCNFSWSVPVGTGFDVNSPQAKHLIQ